MIHIEKDFKDIPESLNYSKHKIRMRNLLIEKHKHCFAGYNDEEVKEKLVDLYNHKCAYCESKLEPGNLIIEHYRPKHQYYWLAYEWTNLIIACMACNNSGTKGTKFPIKNEGKRVKVHSDDKKEWRANSNTLQNEEPLLLHPEIDIPEEHIKFNYDGKADGITEKGKETVKICNLNRESLWIIRKKDIDDAFRDVRDELIKVLRLKEKGAIKKMSDIFEIDIFRNVFNKAKEYCEKENEYSSLFCYMYKHFEEFLDFNCLTKNLREDYKKIIKMVFEKYKNESQEERVKYEQKIYKLSYEETAATKTIKGE